MAASFTLWVQDENPDQTFLLALLLRVCKEQPSLVPQEFRQYVQGRLDHSHKLSYQVSRNYSKGGCNVVFTLHPYTASSKTKGIGVVFDIDALGGGFYGSQAWRVFMRNLRPEKIIGCILWEGDTSESLNDRRREFCIGIFGPGLDVEAVKAAFAGSSEKGLAPSNRRFILSPRLDSEPLVEAGMIDCVGRLVRDEWDRGFHDRCKDSGWGFAPRKITVNLSSELKSELKTLQDRTVSSSAPAAQPLGAVSPPQASKPWWKFWA